MACVNSFGWIYLDSLPFKIIDILYEVIWNEIFTGYFSFLTLDDTSFLRGFYNPFLDPGRLNCPLVVLRSGVLCVSTITLPMLIVRVRFTVHKSTTMEMRFVTLVPFHDLTRRHFVHYDHGRSILTKLPIWLLCECHEVNIPRHVYTKNFIYNNA